MNYKVIFCHFKFFELKAVMMLVIQCQQIFIEPLYGGQYVIYTEIFQKSLSHILKDFLNQVEGLFLRLLCPNSPCSFWFSFSDKGIIASDKKHFFCCYWWKCVKALRYMGEKKLTGNDLSNKYMLKYGVEI